MKAQGNGDILSAFLLTTLLMTGCATPQTPAEQAAEQPNPDAPPAAADDIGLEKRVEVPDIDVDTDARMPERR